MIEYKSIAFNLFIFHNSYKLLVILLNIMAYRLLIDNIKHKQYYINIKS